MQEHLLRMLGSGGALYELYSAVLDEPGLTEEEQVEYTALKSAADPLPAFCNQWDAGNKPPLNPAQLLGVDFTSSREDVRLRQTLQGLPSCFLRASLHLVILYSVLIQINWYVQML